MSEPAWALEYFRGRLYADAYNEAADDFRVWNDWNRFLASENSAEKITIHRPTRVQELEDWVAVIAGATRWRISFGGL